MSDTTSFNYIEKLYPEKLSRFKLDLILNKKNILKIESQMTTFDLWVKYHIEKLCKT